MIKLVRSDEINKNANAVVDKGCQELEEEMKRLDPEGTPINIATLKLAVLNLNARLRRKGCISAFEINSARNQDTGENLVLNDDQIRENQLINRKHPITSTVKEILVGDTVRIKNKIDKHKANEMFIVTSKEGENINMQKVIHPLSMVPTKLASKSYNTRQKYVTLTHRPESMQDQEENDIECNAKKSIQKPKYLKSSNNWSPINSQFFNGDETSDSEDEDIPKTWIKQEVRRFEQHTPDVRDQRDSR